MSVCDCKDGSVFLFVPSDTFAVGCIVLVTKAPQKNEKTQA